MYEILYILMLQCENIHFFPLYITEFSLQWQIIIYGLQARSLDIIFRDEIWKDLYVSGCNLLYDTWYFQNIFFWTPVVVLLLHAYINLPTAYLVIVRFSDVRINYFTNRQYSWETMWRGQCKSTLYCFWRVFYYYYRL